MKNKRLIMILLAVTAVLTLFISCEEMKEKAVARTKEIYAWVEFDGNGAVSGEAPIERKYIDPGEIFYMKDNLGNFQKPGYTFTGWNTAADGSGRSFAVNTYFMMGYENVTLYAQWE